jgi:hypothetical protein
MSFRPPSPDSLSRRRFLRQSFAFSALASLGSFSGLAASPPPDPAAAQLLVLGDWGYEDKTAQAQVAAGLRAYAKQHSVRPQALLMLGDNWYGELAGGAGSSRWKTQFEDMYPPSISPALPTPCWGTTTTSAGRRAKSMPSWNTRATAGLAGPCRRVGTALSFLRRIR